jgi:uncharacterized SAM-binding protein YcdF (DUF218 family)
MIRRMIAFLLLAWILGFAWFALFLPAPAGTAKTDAVVVLTGGTNRIDRGLQIIRQGKARRMLISGVDRDVKPAELAIQYKDAARIFDCCVDLGFRAVDTRSNALETARWVKRHNVKSVRLVTNNWHMRRARFELDQAMPSDIRIVNDAVPAAPTFKVLFKEYTKFLLRGVAALLGI